MTLRRAPEHSRPTRQFPALAVGVGWVVLGAVYLAFLTKGFTRKPPELGVQ